MERYAKLRGLIREKYRSERAFAEQITMHPSTLSAKLNGHTQWAFNEVVEVCKALGIPLTDACGYFYEC